MLYDAYTETEDYLEFETSLSKRLFKPLPLEIKDYAISYVLGEVSSSLKEELYSYIDKRFEKLGTCILWDKTPELYQLLAKHGVSIGSKEAIIKRDVVLTSKDKKVTPRVTFSL